MLFSKKLMEESISGNLKELITKEYKGNFKEINDHLILKINQVKGEIVDLTNQSFNIIKPELDKTEEIIEKINELNVKTNGLKRELEEQEKLLKNVSEIDEYKNLIEHIDSVNKIIYTIKLMQKFENKLADYKLALDKKEYNRCNECLNDLIQIIENEPELFKTKSNNSTIHNDIANQQEKKEIYLIKQLKEDFIVHRERLWFDLDQEWNNLLSVEIEDPKMSKIVISKQINQEILNELTQFSKYKLITAKTTTSDQASISSFVFLSKLKQFSKIFLKLCTINIINEVDNSESLNEIKIIDQNESKALVFEKKSIDELGLVQSNNQHQKIDPSKLLEFKLIQIEKILKFLNENFFKFTAILYENSLAKNGKESKTNLKIMTIFSNIVLNEFVKLIYEQLIINIIPLKNFEFKIEAEICKHVANFEEALKSIEFIKNDAPSVFKSFVSNVEELYVRKKCQHIMETARHLMKNKDLLLEVVKIDQHEFLVNQINIAKESKLNQTVNSINLIERLINLEESNTSQKTKLDESNLLRMPKCSISKMANQILEIIYQTLNEAYIMSEHVESLKNVSLLCLVSRNLLELYSCVVPTFHADSIREMPFLSAVSFNDFAYLAFNCLTLTHQYKELFLSLKKKTHKEKSTSRLALSYFELDDVINSFSCLDLVPKLCSIGYNLLNKQLEKQQENLIQFLNEDTNGLRDMSENNNFELLKKGLGKCKIQLNTMSSIWLNILPENVYFSAFGNFLDLICNDLLKSCLSLEDISSEDADYLHQAFSIIEHTVYNLYSKNIKFDSNNMEILDLDETSKKASIKVKNSLADLNANKYMKSWQRFKYMLTLLKANLQEIVDLWSEGKGPLAMYFDSEEIRHLIKALFMITERRSAALATIN